MALNLIDPKDWTPSVFVESLDQPLSLHPFGARQGDAAWYALQTAGAVPLLGTHVGATIDWAVEASRRAPLPGFGRTAEAWEVLASAAVADVSAARAMEPHLDARSIITQAGIDGYDVDLDAINADDDSSWGVYAAEGARLEARPTDEGWVLSGTKNWCSLADDLSHALVTAWTGAETRRLFAIDLKCSGVHAHRGPWHARGLSRIVSAPVDFDDVPATPVGPDGWYLQRPGFAWGGMGVAAVWWGATAPLVRAVVDRAASEGADQIAAMYAGAADTAFWSLRSVLAEAAHAVDAGVTGRDLRITAERVRAIAASTVEEVIRISDHALGPGPLTTDEKHARRVSDLRIYVRQHHAERDLARLGSLLARR
ncbi:acyl-CoA dehydrogenase [Microbacterium koreense]|uniref:Acyl-CoA dehydrogenase n=1 Tax=Microbacterium koreense TaxID=323761 RepID=A0ABW2ZP73_9MICO